MKNFLAALRYLTLWGRFNAPKKPENIGASAIYFPLIGLLLGLLLALLNYSLAVYLDGEILSVLLIGVLAAATGGIHLEAAWQTFEAWRLHRGDTSESSINILPIIAIFFLLTLKINAVDVIDDKTTLCLLLTPVFARWTLVLFIYGYHDRCDDISRRIAEHVRFWHLLVTTLATLGAAVYFLGRKGLWIGLLLSIMSLLIRALLHRRHSVLTHANFGALVEVSETLSLVLLATL